MAAVLAFERLPALEPHLHTHILAFARRPATPPGLSMRDRIEIDRWSWEVADHGVSRVRIEHAEPGDLPAISAIVLIYCHGDAWATWAVAPDDDDGFEVWTMYNSRTLGHFPSMAAALASLPAIT